MRLIFYHLIYRELKRKKKGKRAEENTKGMCKEDFLHDIPI